MAKVIAFNDEPVKITDRYPRPNGMRVEDRGDGKLRLLVTKIWYYDHPEAPGQCFIPVDTEMIVGEYISEDKEYPLVQMLYLNQMAIERLLRESLKVLDKEPK